MAVTVLSGTSGALYYKPAGTTCGFGTAAVSAADDEITLIANLGFRVGDPVEFSVVNSQTGGAGSGTLPAGLSASTTYYVIAYSSTTGIMEVSATAGGAAVNITDAGTIAAPNEFQVAYADFAAVGQVQSWSFEISRAEIDVTTIGQPSGKYAPFRSYIAGFADGSGSATVYVTNEDASLANRMVEDVLLLNQVGCGFKLYTDKQSTELLSRSITMDAVLLTASQTINPDDAQQVEITFRPAAAPTFDLTTTA